MSGRTERVQKRTTFWDFLIALGGGIVNLIKIEKVICIIFLYLIGRDIYFTVNIDKGDIYREKVIDAATIFKLILENDNNDILYISIIIVLTIILLILIFVIKSVYVREIDRLSKERSRLIHDIRNGDFKPLKTHYSSKGN